MQQHMKNIVITISKGIIVIFLRLDNYFHH